MDARLQNNRLSLISGREGPHIHFILACFIGYACNPFPVALPCNKTLILYCSCSHEEDSSVLAFTGENFFLS